MGSTQWAEPLAGAGAVHGPSWVRSPTWPLWVPWGPSACTSSAGLSPSWQGSGEAGSSHCEKGGAAGALEPSGHHHPGLLTFLLRSWCFPCRHGNLVTRICSFASVRLQRGMVGGVHLLHTHILYQAPAGALYLTQKLCGSPHPTPAPVGSPCHTHGLHTPHRPQWALPTSHRDYGSLHPAGLPCRTDSASCTGPCRLPLLHGLRIPHWALRAHPMSHRNLAGLHTPHWALRVRLAAHMDSTPHTGPCGFALPHTETLQVSTPRIRPCPTHGLCTHPRPCGLTLPHTETLHPRLGPVGSPCHTHAHPAHLCTCTVKT